MAVEERAAGRAGLEGGRDRGLWDPSLSLPWLLGGVGGICTRSSTEKQGYQVNGCHVSLTDAIQQLAPIQMGHWHPYRCQVAIGKGTALKQDWKKKAINLIRWGMYKNKAGLSFAQDRGETDLKCAKLGTAGVRELAGGLPKHW